MLLILCLASWYVFFLVAKLLYSCSCFSVPMSLILIFIINFTSFPHHFLSLTLPIVFPFFNFSLNNLLLPFTVFQVPFLNLPYPSVSLFIKCHFQILAKIGCKFIINYLTNRNIWYEHTDVIKFECRDASLIIWFLILLGIIISKIMVTGQH